MFRKSLGPDRGMIFPYEPAQEVAFWMKNTLIPLDMIFVRADGTVAGVVADAEPLTLESRSIGEPSRYVVEVNAGWAARHGVVAGTRMRLENVAGAHLDAAGTR